VGESVSTTPRRSFLKGSAFFAAALVAARGSAQDPKPDPPKDAPPKEAPKESPKEKPKEERRRGPKTDEEIFAEQEKAKQKEELVDDEGRQYRICPQCGFKMYRQGRTWTCSNCGYNYVD